ncbi:MAG: CBS domain-containing protein [Pirellulales bacterium]|nr:CBS domain-containing protein [Planctomycetales bacterium]
MDFESSLNTESVGEALTTPVCVEASATVREVFALLKKRNTGSVLICDHRRLQGIFTERDALRLMARGDSLDVPISDVMIDTPSTIGPDATVGDAIRQMFSGGYRRLPIIDANGAAIGIVKVSTVIHYLVQHFPQAVYNLPPVPDPIMQEREGS